MSKQRFYYLLYISTAVTPFSKDDLLQLLAKSRENNAKLEITGLLLYKKGVFQQILEGPEPGVITIFDKIRADARHRGILKVLEGFEDERQFPEWSMGFCDLSSAEAAALPGYTPFLNTSLMDAQFVSNPHLCQQLMVAFKTNLQS